MCSFKIIWPPGLKHLDAFDADDERPDPVETEHHAIFACPGYVSARVAREVFQDLFADDNATVGQFFAQPDCDCIAEFLTEIKSLRSCLSDRLRQAPNRLNFDSIQFIVLSARPSLVSISASACIDSMHEILR